MKNEGKAEQLASVDLISALDMYVEQGNWERALDTAATHGPEMLHKYVATCATEAIRQGRPVEALELYKKYGAPAFPQNFNIYKRIAIDLFALPYDDENLGRNNYYTWANLRDIMFELTENMSKDSDGDQALEDFKLLLLISHYLGNSHLTGSVTLINT